MPAAWAAVSWTFTSAVVALAVASRSLFGEELLLPAPLWQLLPSLCLSGDSRRRPCAVDRYDVDVWLGCAMAAYVNDGCTGWTELRVHGVSGTPPDKMLESPQVKAVAGDANAAFFRRRYESPLVSADNDQQRAEAYSWGGMTAGSGQRALWLLLTPFMLVNVAAFALPPPPLEEDCERTEGHPPGTSPSAPFRTGQKTRFVAEALLRIFALSTTMTFVLVPVQVAMDLIGWQCVQRGRNCAASSSWLAFLNWTWLNSPGRRLAVTSLVPLAVVALLGWLGRSTWLRLEKTEVPPADAQEEQQTPLEDRRMWNGRESVRRLRAVHMTAAFAIIGVFLVSPLTGTPELIVLIVLVVLVGLAALLACWPAISRRERPSAQPSGNKTDGYTSLPVVTGTVVAVAVVLAVASGTKEVRGGPSLPGLAGVIQGLLTGQLLALLIMTVLLARLNREAPAAQALDSALDRSGEPIEDHPAWRGMVAPALMMLALLWLGGFAAGTGIRIADLLGTPAVKPVNSLAFVLPNGYFSAAAVTVVLAAVLLGLAVVGWRRLVSSAERIAPQLDGYYPDITGEENSERRRVIARIWARAEIGDVLQWLLGWFLAITAVVLVGGLALFYSDARWLLTHARWLVNAGTFLVGGFVLLLLYVGRQAYRNPSLRRTVGVLWDLGTFWPRAAHPLAPPCYSERAVPDLMTRIRYLGDPEQGGRVLLSCHSQGAMIGVAVVMQLTYAESASVALLTYGNPLRRLYCRFFPTYFNVTVLNRAGSFLLGCADDGAARSKRPWRNLHRRSDPIGGALFVAYPAEALGSKPTLNELLAGDNGDTDRQLVDPAFSRPSGDTCDPSPCGHSNYYADPAFDVSAQIVKGLRIAFPSRRDSGLRAAALPNQIGENQDSAMGRRGTEAGHEAAGRRDSAAASKSWRAGQDPCGFDCSS